MPYIPITISCYTFQLSSPFQSGRDITLADRQALDALRAENIRNNAAKALKRMLEKLPKGQLLSKEQLADFQRKIDEMDAQYEFAERAHRGPRDSITAEALRIAQQTGRPADDEAVVEEARRRIEARQRSAQELLGGGLAL